MARITINRSAAASPQWETLPIGTLATVRRPSDGTLHTMVKVFAPKKMAPRVVSLTDPAFVASKGASKGNSFSQCQPIEVLGVLNDANIGTRALTAAERQAAGIVG